MEFGPCRLRIENLVPIEQPQNCRILVLLQIVAGLAFQSHPFSTCDFAAISVDTDDIIITHHVKDDL